MNRSSGLLSPRGQVLMFAALALLAFTAFPFAWMASTALKPSREIFVTPPTLWPTHVTLDNLSRLFAETRFLTYFRNSLTVSFATVGLTLLVSVPAAYGLTRFRFHWRETVAGLILFTYMFARVLLSADEMKTLPVGIADLYNASVVDWGMIMAAGVLVIAPVAAVFVFIQRFLVAGWGSGGVKG